MTESDIQAVITHVLASEGGFTDDPVDRGGRTNFGITQATADVYGFGDVAQLTQASARAAYRSMFAKWGIDKVTDASAFALVADCCVNHGQGRSIGWLQSAVGLVPDGSIGPKSIAAFAAVTAWEPVYASILARRVQFYGAIVEKDRTQAKFIFGWLNRAASFLSPWPYA